jgi:hypothetical protein
VRLNVSNLNWGFAGIVACSGGATEACSCNHRSQNSQQGEGIYLAIPLCIYVWVCLSRTLQLRKHTLSFATEGSIWPCPFLSVVKNIRRALAQIQICETLLQRHPRVKQRHPPLGYMMKMMMMMMMINKRMMIMDDDEDDDGADDDDYDEYDDEDE